MNAKCKVPRSIVPLSAFLLVLAGAPLAGQRSAPIDYGTASEIGKEVAIPRHLQDGEEYQIPVPQLIAYGQKLFNAMWTVQEGAGRPLSKGTGAPVSDPHQPLVFPRKLQSHLGARHQFLLRLPQ